MLVGGADLRVGCSGWSYDEWVGRWYPDDLAASERLGWYADRFDTVEINSTHYRTPTPTAVAAWCASVPDNFQFAVKLHRFGTHRKKLLQPDQWVPRSLEPVVQMRGRCGAMLLQLPPHWTPQLDRLDHTLVELNRHAPRSAGPVVVEVRDPRWLGVKLGEVLVRRRAVLCLHDLLPGLLDAGRTSALRAAVDGARPMTKLVYLRFHGPDPARPYRGAYGAGRLRPLAALAAELLSARVDVQAYFNNDVDAHAPRDALVFRELVVELAK